MSRFVSDCSRCCGLCCIVPAYRACQGFAVNKQADRPCRHLQRCGDCSIHDHRQELGYEACTGFDCHGAGQWITQHLFGGASWFDSPDVAAEMSAAYRYWLPRFEAAALIEVALPLVADAERPALLARIELLLDPAARADSRPADHAALRRETLAMIRALLA